MKVSGRAAPDEMFTIDPAPRSNIDLAAARAMSQ
jgi:hypothetical protein